MVGASAFGLVALDASLDLPFGDAGLGVWVAVVGLSAALCRPPTLLLVHVSFAPGAGTVRLLATCLFGCVSI